MKITVSPTVVPLQIDTIWAWLVDIWVWISVSFDYYVYIGIEYAIFYYPPCYEYVTWFGHTVFSIPYSAYTYSSASAAASASSSASATAIAGDSAPVVIVERFNDAPQAFDVAGPSTFMILVIVAIVAIVALAAIGR